MSVALELEPAPSFDFAPPGFLMRLIQSPPRPTLLRLGRALYPQIEGAFKAGDILSVPFKLDPTIVGWVLEFDDGTMRRGP